jgi:hypothetical protein
MSPENLRVGIDFDNTIVCYDDIFYRVASERGLIPAETPKNKESVRDYLRRAGKEDDWTEMQGYVYGARMSDVTAFPGALDCIAKLKAKKVPVFIISHKTRRPYKGKPYDLHAAARQWLEASGISLKDVFLMETKEKKLEQIGKCSCTHFIDDLPEFLAEPAFPKNTIKLLFSPARTQGPSFASDAAVFRSWHEIDVFLSGASEDHEDVLRPKILALLPGVNALRMERLPTSGNNRLYLLTTEKEKFVAKHYFTHPGDKRNRLRSEYSFASFAFKNGIDCLPRPVACDTKNHLAVYAFIEGKKPDSSDVTKTAVKAALDFLIEINQYRDKAGKDLPSVSESCFSMSAHMKTIGERVERLFAITDDRVKNFVKEELVPVWDRVREETFSKAKAKEVNISEELPLADRIISPSDFGFHNCIIGDNGKFYFLDFEYAGWDDPAKTAGDFFSQPARPVPIENLEMFARGVSGLTSDPGKTMARIYWLLQPYRVKWCCIVLNHFLSTDSERRKFSGNNVDQAKEEQLGKAKKLLDSVEELPRDP